MNIIVTFRQIERRLKIAATQSSDNSPLEKWYEDVRDTPITEFSDGDLSKSCRQSLYLDIVVPVAIERINLTPLAGEMYDGELLVALASISHDFWLAHQKLAEQLGAVLDCENDDIDDVDISEAIKKLRDNASNRDRSDF